MVDADSEGKEGLAKKSCFSLATKSAGWEERRGGNVESRDPIIGLSGPGFHVREQGGRHQLIAA